MDLESKWYQQAAAIKEKHKVSLSFKPRAVHRFLFVFVVFIVFCLFFLFVFFWGGFVFLFAGFQ